uniref:Neur_chan_LBD domain-containing protein n=1 Tax=Macrostomum lignano TaxID=282301 RepID=A0A1I8J982_9PLAT
MNYLLHGYELSVRPVFNSSKPVTTLMGITLTQIFDMDEKNQVLVSNVWLDQQWKDEFLTWDPEEFSNQAKIRLPSSKIWKPDLVLYNNAADFADSLMPALAMIDSNGTVFWPIPTKLRSSCKVDVTYFPFDEQVCNLKFGSWTYDGYQVDLHLLKSDVDVSSYVENGEWELLGTKASDLRKRNVVRYPCCPEPYPDVTFYLFLRRRLLYYMYHVIYPCIMMSTLTLLVFCLPPDSGEKIALGITVLLAFSVLMLSIADRLPETSESVPLISIYLTVVMSMTSVSVIMTVFVLNLHHRGPSRSPVPNWLRRLLLQQRFGSDEDCGMGAGRRAAASTSTTTATSLETGAGVRAACGNGPGCARATSFIENLGLKLTIDSLAGDFAAAVEDAEDDNNEEDVEASTAAPLRAAALNKRPRQPLNRHFQHQHNQNLQNQRA